MDAAQTIRDAVDQVAALRRAREGSPALRAAITEVKQFQARRFAHTYADMLSAGPYQNAARFFLDELYSDKDYTQRDAQFSRIASALQRFFPKQVVATAVSLAQLHALTESLDHAMGLAWLTGGKNADRMNTAARYAAAWRVVGRRENRDSQLIIVLAVGQELDKLTRTPGLRLMLKMMRRPAQAAGLNSLQSFLESGFDTFADMGNGGGASEFLSVIRQRESELIEALFSPDIVAFETALRMP